MKPAEARARRRAVDKKAARRMDRLELLLAGDDPDRPDRDLIPTEEDLLGATRAVRKLVRRANRTRRDQRRVAILEELVTAVAVVVYIERVLALDPLERAALTPARLLLLSRISPADVEERMNEWQRTGR